MDRVLYNTLKNGTFASVPQKRSATMRAIRGKGNQSTERRLRLALVRAGVKGWQLNPIVEGIRPDFLFGQEKLAIFLDGCFWHGCPDCAISIPRTNRKYWKTKIQCNRKRDTRFSALLKARGLQVLRIWEHELRYSADGVVGRVQATLTSIQHSR
jgi:DNA mismatch endonuclease, patch repair protein